MCQIHIAGLKRQKQEASERAGGKQEASRRVEDEQETEVRAEGAYNHAPLDEHWPDAEVSEIGWKGYEPKAIAQMQRGAARF